MKIAAGTLFLGLSLFLHSIELSTQSWAGSSSSSSSRSRVPLRFPGRAPSQESISSTPRPQRPIHTTLDKLFPKSEGVHFPDIEELSFEHHTSDPNFKIFNGQMISSLHLTSCTFLKRGPVIFAFKGEQNIEPLGPLFKAPHLYAVFNTENHQWYTLSAGELQKLGVNRHLPFVRAHDEAHAVVHYPYREVNSEAHNAASKVAYLRTKDHEATRRELLFDQPERVQKNYAYMSTADYAEPIRIPLFSEKGGVESVKDYYHQEYNKAYQSQTGGQSDIVVRTFSPKRRRQKGASSSRGFPDVMDVD